ncbi:phosphopantetheine-binding protein [Variovorax sp. PAMC 28711]|uniref:phosphopantetheine-binding protein n=1 Tax=Variovorax sp. PAMC 28711 TaxID=1795631 RepID=UPI00078D12B4|nr:phosphopantetheine-binding protein [Variovorax sp. PAMC 28711]AMM26719.1 phosphopantetheine-binding protein [Variovorax sp. PAMC 28711]
MSNPTFNTLSGILQKDFHVAPEVIAPPVALAELGLDSLALMEFVFAVEDAFHLRIPEDKLDPREAGITLQRLCEVIDALPAHSPPMQTQPPALAHA